jgi:mRNA-degrading endonuclease toxin of MazEF toxin-antitoxin module
VRGIPTEVQIGRDDGMLESCALTVDNTLLMPKSFLVERQCRLGLAKMLEVCLALQIATGCTTAAKRGAAS